MAGYDSNFLGIAISLPGFSPALVGEILADRVHLLDGIYAEYVNYTLAMHRELRTPVFVALNIDQNRITSVSRRDNWRIDSRVGADNQLDNDYYRHNPWDRGHLARRSSAAWGATRRAAQLASDETFYFTNACLQHRNFNQDEWLALEDWVKDLALDKDGRISVFSGPIFGDFSRTLKPQGRPRAVIPSAFFKVVCFIDKQDTLQTRAFIMPQDSAALADRQGRRMLDFQNYQVSVAEIERLTGLIFPDAVPDSNPLFFNDNDEARRDLAISHFPEHIEVDGSEEIVGRDQKRTPFADQEVDVFIAAALVNPAGSERDNEWISLINLTADTVDLAGWRLSDTKRQPLTLSGNLGPGEAIRIGPIRPLQLANKGGAILLHDDRGRLIDRVKYTKDDAAAEGRVINFAYRAEG